MRRGPDGMRKVVYWGVRIIMPLSSGSFTTTLQRAEQIVTDDEGGSRLEEWPNPGTSPPPPQSD